MDISSEFMMEALLNVTGYLAAGALAVVLYAMRRRRTAPAAAIPEKETTKAKPAVAAPADGETMPTPQFINLLGETPASTGAATNSGSTQSLAERYHSSRRDIVKMAREMLADGASPDKVQRALPISEAELSLLGLEKN